MDICGIVDVEEHRLTCQQRGVGGRASNHRQELTPCNLRMRMVEVSVFRGVIAAEPGPYLEMSGPRCRVNRTARQRRCRLEIEAEAIEAGV